MNQAHIHLILNHFPIVGSLIGTALLIYGLLIKNNAVQKVSLIVIILMSIIAIPVFLTGEPAEEAVENIQGINEGMIEEHEESAEISFWIMMLTGGASIIAYALSARNRYSANFMIKTTAVLGIASSIMMVRTGYLGGQIRHTEFNSVSEVAGEGENPTGNAGESNGTPEGSDD